MPAGVATRRAIWLLRILLSLLLLLAMIVLAIAGGLLNRFRGGMGKGLTDDGYWGEHVYRRLIMSLTTGALALAMSLHLRAGLLVFVVTWFSLYAGWDAYVTAELSEGASCAGIFDWALGRSEVNWSDSRNFMREYTGMSMRGLLWTAPAGYGLHVMGLGWQYSLSGSLMGLAYHVGGKVPAWDTQFAQQNLNGQWSEMLWGWWAWLVLQVICVSSLVERSRRYARIAKGEDCCISIRPVCRLAYEVIIFAINFIFACSVGYYELVVQVDVRNKGQTFFGLYNGVLLLLATQSFNWGGWWQRYHDNKQKEPDPAINVNTTQNTETSLLLPWPQNHPNAGQGLLGSSQEAFPLIYRPREQCRHVHQVWHFLETLFLLDVLLLARWLIGILAVLHTLLVLSFFVMCFIWNIDAPRFYIYANKNCTI